MWSGMKYIMNKFLVMAEMNDFWNLRQFKFITEMFSAKITGYIIWQARLVLDRHFMIINSRNIFKGKAKLLQQKGNIVL